MEDAYHSNQGHGLRGSTPGRRGRETQLDDNVLRVTSTVTQRNSRHIGLGVGRLYRVRY